MCDGAISNRLAPPPLGQHTDQIPEELGIAANESIRLHECEVV
jgi:crotonobetainyl-CoA:carnitine CoA-transferase CaiB-like acyl-CoA transferase